MAEQPPMLTALTYIRGANTRGSLALNGQCGLRLQHVMSFGLSACIRFFLTGRKLIKTRVMRLLKVNSTIPSHCWFVAAVVARRDSVARFPAQSGNTDCSALQPMLPDWAGNLAHSGNTAVVT